MPTTRSQAAEEKTLRVYEDYPASPSENAPAFTMEPQTTEQIATTSKEATAITKPSDAARKPTSRAPSIRSHRSTTSALARIKQAELAAEEQLASIRRQDLQIQAMLVKKKLAADVATIRDETDRESICVEEREAEQRVSDWLQHAHVRGEQEQQGDTTDLETTAYRHRSPPRRRSSERQPPVTPNHVTFERAQQRKRSPTPTGSKEHGIERLANTLEKMTRGRTTYRQSYELPTFSGASGEWLPFKAAMRDSTDIHGFTSIENLARLRSCIKGEAKQKVSALLYTAKEPATIMRTLEQCYGRPEVIINQALEEMRKLPRLGPSAADLNSFAIKIQNIVAVITSLDEKDYLRNPMLVQHVTDRLSPHINTMWCHYAEEHVGPSEAEIVKLSRFLMNEADHAMRHSYANTTIAQPSASRGNKEPQPRPTNERRRGANVYATTEAIQKKDVCYCCGATHETARCRKLGAMSVPERWEWAKETRMCFVCLNSKHRRFKCRAKRCGVNECRLPHHALLHLQQGVKDLPPTEDTVITASTHETSPNDKVMLKICPITIRGPKGHELETHALLDEGSTVTLIDEEVARMVGAQGPTKALRIHGATTSQTESGSRVVDVQIKGTSQKNYHTVRARTVRSLTLGTHTANANALEHPHLRGLNLGEVCFQQVRPRILIGADQWHLIVTRKLLAGKRNQPAASYTQLGWVLHGAVPNGVMTEKGSEAVVLHMRTPQSLRRERSPEEKDELSDLVRAHFDIDALGIRKERKPIPAEQRAIEIFNRTARRIDGHFEVGLPWSEDRTNLPPSYDMALSRLRGIERKMDRSPLFKEAYTKEIMKLLEKGYATECKKEHADGHLWYLPHFAVTNPNKPGKVRMVFDAAARVNGTCLNDALLDGPDLLRTLHGVLFRFRTKPVAVTADIREMFLRIKIRPEDRPAQHFLWRGENRTKPPQRYVMTSMIFGARSSPFLAHSVRDKNAKEHQRSHPLAYSAITENHYMDDWVESFSSEEEAAQAIKQVTEVHRRAGFELAGWSSNNRKLLIHIPETDKTNVPKELGANAHAFEKTLGVLWQSGTDELTFNTSMPRVPEDVRTSKRTPTKREALSAVMSIFDPLGLLSPYTITAKIMLQGLWRQDVGWDESIPPEEACVFDEWQADLEHIKELRLPRCYSKRESVDTQLHVFCDASEEAYATAAYWRLKYDDGSKRVILVAGKAKVAPMKAQSIPRLELQASLIGARLASEILKEHKIQAKLVMWSDSKTALHWIKNEAARYTPYVAHRVSEITDLTRAEQWRWVPTMHNVADDATRSGYTKLKNQDRWFIGPAFLYKEEEHWPREEGTSELIEEVRTEHIHEETQIINVSRFSKYERLVRAMAYVFAFIDKCRRQTATMNTNHVKKAELWIIKEAQKDSFPEEVKQLKRGKKVERTSRLWKLDPKYGNDEIIRLNGRINAASVPDEMKEPPILDGAHPLTRLLIQKQHHANMHVGREHIVNNIRQQYWVLRLRPAVRAALKECVQCKIRKAAPLQPVKGDLPKARLNAHARPFSHCGVDCFGPMWVTIGRRKEKRWGMLFTCLVTRAVHIEMIASLSTDSAIMALRRMAARRGWPERMMSDNGTNFHGADVELEKAYKNWLPALQEYGQTKRMEWRFIDPGAPNQGGAWERMIRSVKTALTVTLNERAPKEEVLSTAMLEIEHTVNSRPLTHVPVDPDDPEALTPNHFLLGTATGLPSVGACDLTDRSTWKAAQALANVFWTRWIKEYLPTLLPRNDVRKNADNIKEGNIVVIADGLLPRNVWPRGQVEKIYEGPDGVVRSVDVRTKGGIFRRPVKRLVVLPISNGCEDLRRGEDVTDNECHNSRKQQTSISIE